jgi:microcystin-dependent protein
MTNFSDILKLSLQETGENPTTWGDIANIVFNKVEDAIAGTHTVNVTTASNITLTSTNGVTDEASNMILKLSGTPTADIDIIVPNKSKLYVIDGTAFLGSFTITIKASGGTGVSFTTLEKGLIYCDGTDTFLIGEPNVTSIPSGLIAMWGGTLASIPSGWSLCNGTGATQDLRGKFIIGANADNGTLPTTNITGSATTTGGSKDINFTSGAGGDHDHGGNTQSHVLTISQIPPHTHTYISSSLGSDSSGVTDTASNITKRETESTGGGSGHSHGITTSGTHTHTITSTNANLTPYYALAFIQKD